MILQGIAASDGIGIGPAVCIRAREPDCSAVPYSGREKERDRLQAAADLCAKQTAVLAERVRTQAGSKATEILTGQTTMLADPVLRRQMEEIIDGGQPAEAAVDQVCAMYAGLFAGTDDERMVLRSADVRDLRSRMLSILLEAPGADMSALPPGSVLAVHDLTPSMAAGLDRAHVAAVLTEVGGSASHSAILARALELPAVFGVPQVTERLQNGDPVIVDGSGGLVVVRPDPQTLSRYLARREEDHRQPALLAVYRDQKTVDADGRHYALYANINSPAEVKTAAASGAEGIGLFRTEFLFLDRPCAPDENEQYEAYLAISKAMAGREVIIRTLDVGGDKAAPCLSIPPETNPVLGHRGIRFCLDDPDRYKTQLRALLRAGAQERNIKLTLPLVTSVEEVRTARALLETCKAELTAEGLPCYRDLPLGIMVETPAAALTADLLAQVCDFFSIGTNDLTQYLMAADRDNAQVAHLCTPFQPAVLRAIRGVIAAAKKAGIPVGMCGEAAADPRLIPLFLSWGLDEFSVRPSAVPAVRAQIRRWHAEQAGLLAQKAMELPTASDVERCLQAAAQQ